MSKMQIFPNPEALADGAARLFVRLARAAIGARGRFMVALSGGSTPQALFGLLAAEPYRGEIEWTKLQLFWSDERAVPADDPQSNYRMARETLLERVPVPAAQVHRMPAEQTPLLHAATEYTAEIRRAFDTSGDGVPRFDLIMLGMGEDGHTASLFPETEALNARDQLIAPNYVPKLDAHRLTFTARLINAAANVVFLIAGAGKADALQAVLEGPRQPRRFPSQLVAPANGTLYWYLDAAAAANLQHRSE